MCFSVYRGRNHSKGIGIDDPKQGGAAWLHMAQVHLPNRALYPIQNLQAIAYSKISQRREESLHLSLTVPGAFYHTVSRTASFPPVETNVYG